MRALICIIGVLMIAALPARAQSLAERIAACSGCHGEKGISEIVEVPSLGGQPVLYLLNELVQFRFGVRPNSLMNQFAKGLSDAELQALAEHFAKFPAPQPPTEGADPARVASGKAVAARNRCALCHESDFAGRAQMARLANQRQDYLIKALSLYKSGERLGNDPAMSQVVSALSEPDIRDLAHFLAHLPGK